MSRYPTICVGSWMANNYYALVFYHEPRWFGLVPESYSWKLNVYTDNPEGVPRLRAEQSLTSVRFENADAALYGLNVEMGCHAFSPVAFGVNDEMWRLMW